MAQSRRCSLRCVLRAHSERDLLVASGKAMDKGPLRALFKGKPSSRRPSLLPGSRTGKPPSIGQRASSVSGDDFSTIPGNDLDRAFTVSDAPDLSKPSGAASNNRRQSIMFGGMTPNPNVFLPAQRSSLSVIKSPTTEEAPLAAGGCDAPEALAHRSTHGEPETKKRQTAFNFRAGGISSRGLPIYG